MVYDTFIFFNELELLELRLNELSDVVDRFILVEATRTFTNKPKPLYYAENKHLFSKFNHKITHIIVEDLPESDNPWILERFQRNCIIRGFNNMSDDDIIMISDTDEIPRAEIVKEVINKLKSENKNSLIYNIIHKIYKSEFLISLFKHIGFLKHSLRKTNPYVYKLEQDSSWYFINMVPKINYKWYGTRICLYRNFTFAEEIRHSGHKIIKNGGWHFTFMGGIERIRDKLQSFSHTELNKPEYLDKSKIIKSIQNYKIHLDDKTELIQVPLDNRFPKYILQNKDKYSALILPEK